MSSERLDHDSSPQPDEASPAAPSAVSVTAPSHPGTQDFHIVGIGASAGGLESLERLFTHLPTDTGMAFVVLQHLSPDFKSLMDELLSRRTPMPIRQAEHEMLVEPNTVYLLPPMKEMIIRQRRLLLNDRDPRHGLTLPIDLFFRSLAQDVGERAVAVILSGSGSDGSRGVQEISQAGGIVFCESPDTAQFNGMPLSAMRTGVVDQVLPPEEIAPAIAALGRPIADGSLPAGAVRATSAASTRSCGCCATSTRIDFSHYKASTVTRRIERRLALNRSLDIDMYVEQLRQRSARAELALRRPADRRHAVLPRRRGVRRAGAPRSSRSSSSAPTPTSRSASGCRAAPPGRRRTRSRCCCTSGSARARRPVNLKILATDVHKASLEVASAGLYSRGAGRRHRARSGSSASSR